ncbi:MAG: tryptophan 7-halogenase [Actinomycetota bacterium]
MRVAVLGAGSAGHMAVAQIAHYLPTATITHFYDPAIPSIGVGEGTTPAFTDWAQRVLGWDMGFLRDRCDATQKAGIVFEGWGDGGDYTHFFGTVEGVACHLSAEKLAAELEQRSAATVVPTRVHAVESTDRTATITTDDGVEAFDVVLDARGFPLELGHDQVALDCVPTDAALLVRGPTCAPRDRTRAVARPHGWIFVIPLGSDTAYGYVHTHAERDLVAVDFDAFLVEESVVPTTERRSLRFPNYRQRSLVDGVVFRIGNRAAFVEPLEATSLGLIVLELQVATAAILAGTLKGDLAATAAAAGASLATTIDETASFVGWHYACGARFDTPFWHRAEAAFDRWFERQAAGHRRRFDEYATRGAALTEQLAQAQTIPEVDALLAPGDTELGTFGGFLDASFAKVGHGIGWFDNADLFPLNP